MWERRCWDLQVVWIIQGFHWIRRHREEPVTPKSQIFLVCHCSTEVFPTQNSLCWFSGACASSTCEVWEGDRNIGCTTEKKAKLFPPNQLQQGCWRSCLLPFQKQTMLSLAFLSYGSKFYVSTEKPAPKNGVWGGLTVLKWQLDKNREHWKISLAPGEHQTWIYSPSEHITQAQGWVLLSSLHQMQWKWANLDFQDCIQSFQAVRQSCS